MGQTTNLNWLAGFLPSTDTISCGSEKNGETPHPGVQPVAGHRSSNAMHIVLRVRWSIVIHHQSDLQMQWVEQTYHDNPWQIWQNASLLDAWNFSAQYGKECTTIQFVADVYCQNTNQIYPAW